MRKVGILMLMICCGYALPAQICEALFLTDGSDLIVAFTDQSTSPSNDPIVTWLWDFDDNGNTSTLKNPIYTFSEAGNFNVELEITTQSGCSDIYTFKVRTCKLEIDFTLGQCNNSGTLELSLSIFDIYDSAEEVDITLDGQSIVGGPFLISVLEPIFLDLAITGDGLQHEITVSSLEREGCINSLTISAPDCGSDCFLSGIDVGYPQGTLHNVNIGDNFFSPSSVGIVLGDIVQFNWVDGGHSTTSDATNGTDAWNSGVLSAGSQFDVQIQNPGTHQYYCIPHGNPGGIGMSGSILANCPSGNNMDLLIKFTASQTSLQGFNIIYDGVLVPQSPFSYQGTGMQEQIITIAGDGNNHSIEIHDVQDPSCILSLEFAAPDCNQGGGDPICSLDFNISPSSECLGDGAVNFPVTVNAVNMSTGFNVMIDGGLPKFYEYSGPATDIIVNLPADGNTRTIEISDVDKIECFATKTITSPDCSLPCGITALIANPLSSNGESTIHLVNVEDFQFNPTIVNISEGDKVEWRWTGQIAHSTTSDVTSGPESWDSGIIGIGSTYLSPALSAGEHQYYCIPHGGPGGQGMSGKVIVLPPCNAENEVSIVINFQITSKRGSSYEVKVDGISKTINTYQAGPSQEAIIAVKGDGLLHNIEIIDNEYLDCHQMIEIVSQNCGGEEPVCELLLETGPLEVCIDNEVQFDLDISALNQSDSFELRIDEDLKGLFTYTGSLSNVNISIPGDGQVHTISITDRLHRDCQASVEITSLDCSLPCNIENLEVSALSDNGEGTIHIIEVEDYQFNPKQIDILKGDIVEWVWTGQIAHTSTSDVAEGPDSWKSDLLNNGASFTSPELSLGEHLYYCEPHGGPGGEGMAGKINVLPECTEMLEALYRVNFQVSGKGSMGYSVFIDDVEYGSYEYQEGSEQEIFIEVSGDGNLHTVFVKDNENIECNLLKSFLTIDCSPVDCEGIEADFNVEVDYEANQVFLQNNSSGEFLESLWDFGDGNISSEENPDHLYQDTGSFTICLTIVDQNNCSSVRCEQINLDKGICEAGFVFQSDANNSLSIQFSDTSIGSFDAWLWGFGDGSISRDSLPIHEYDSPGLYTVCLLVENQEDKCLASSCQEIDVVFTGVEDYLEEDVLIVYPNPQFAHSYLNVNLKDILVSTDLANIEIYSSDGRKRYEKKVEIKGTLKLELDLEAGLYFLRLKTLDRSYSISFVLM